MQWLSWGLECQDICSGYNEDLGVRTIYEVVTTKT